MAMTMKELMAAMHAAGTDGRSKLHMRSEDLQQKQKRSYIKSLKSGVKKKSKLLHEGEIPLPFNPETGEEDDVFNSSNKWRPTQSAESVALALKDMANTNEKLKEALMNRAGVEERDTSDNTFTAVDWEIFNKYRVPRIFTVTVTHVDIPAMGTGPYGKDYAVSVPRDASGNVEGEEPLFLSAYKFFNSKAYEEINAYNRSCESGECKDDEKAQKDKRTQIRGKIPVSDDHPGNYVRIFEIPVNESYEISDPAILDNATVDGMKQYEVISRYKKGIRQCIEQYITRGWKKFDKCFNFFDIEMSGPADGDDSTPQGKANIGLNTKYDKPTTILVDEDSYGPNGAKTKKFRDALGEYIDNDVNVEEKIRNSMNIPVYCEAVENKLAKSLQTVIDIEHDEFITTDVIKAHADFIRLVFGDYGDELVEEVEAGVSGKVAGALDAEKAQAEAKEYDISTEAFNDSSIDDVTVDELDLDIEV